MYGYYIGEWLWVWVCERCRAMYMAVAWGYVYGNVVGVRLCLWLRGIALAEAYGVGIWVELRAMAMGRV